MLSANYMPAHGILLLLAGVALFAQLEFYAILSRAGIPCFRIVGSLCGVALIAVTFLASGGEGDRASTAYQWENFVLLASLIAVFIRQFPQKYNDKPLETIGCTLLGIWYVPYLFSFFARIAFIGCENCSGQEISPTGRLLALYLVVVVKCGDIGAYFVGSYWGRHKLFPRVSPGKTWEGLLGGIASAIVASLLFSILGNQHLGNLVFGHYHAAVLGGLLSVMGVVGDMFESLLKRAAGTKDSGSVIPGIGGLLDVVDSLLFGAPLLYVYVKAGLL